jgi:hypothetical protein
MTDDSATSTRCRRRKPQDTLLRIDGWDDTADSGNDVWVQINSSWRANWR